MIRRHLAATLASMLLLVYPAGADAQMFVPAGRGTLRGLPGVEVFVERLQPELEQDGLSGATIRADVVARLREGGVTMYQSQASNPSPAKAYLYVHLNALRLPQGAGYAISVQLQLRQTLQSPVTNSNIVNAMTWDTGNVLWVSASELQDVRAELHTYISEFVDDWKAVH